MFHCHILYYIIYGRVIFPQFSILTYGFFKTCYFVRLWEACYNIGVANIPSLLSRLNTRTLYGKSEKQEHISYVLEV